MAAEEVVEFLRHIEGDDNDDDEEHGDKECHQIFRQDILVNASIARYV